MVRVSCPTGCGVVPRPYRLRAEPVRCTNCRGWFRALPSVEDGALVIGELLARPGERLGGRAPAKKSWWRRLFRAA